MHPDVFDAFADLLAYPGEDFPARFAAARAAAAGAGTGLAARLRPMARLLAASEPHAVEELYTRTFDMNPPCALEAGWHLYGEDYDRGAFLVHLRALMRRVGVEESVELPDHLSHVLRLLPRLAAEEGGRMARSQILPALGKILAAFGEGENPYREVVAGASDLLTTHFGPADEIPASAFACRAPYEQQDGSFVCPGMPTPTPE